MYILALQIILVLLCSLWVVLGVVLLKSGNKILIGQEPRIQNSIWDRLFYSYYVMEWLFRENKGTAYMQIWLGIMSIIAGIGLLIFLIFGGYLF